ncbi:MAG: hypothetical protein Tsb0016_16820 [Sphingomonadales bacterium]
MRRFITGFWILAAAELLLLLLAAGATGGWPVALWCLLTGIAGVAMIRLQGIALLRRLSRSDQPAMPAAALAGALFAMAGLLLLIPGLLSDALGLVLAVPAVRRRLTGWLPTQAPDTAQADVTIIEGEYRRHPPY